MSQALLNISAVHPAGQVQAAERQQQEHEAALAAAHAARDEADATAARLERQLAVQGKERNGLKRILASYQQDDASAHSNPLNKTLLSFRPHSWSNMMNTLMPGLSAVPLLTSLKRALPLCWS